MANGNKVNNELVEKTKSKFLPEEIIDKEKKSYVYSLDEEFAKTRKNRNVLLYLFIFGFIGVILAGTYLLTRYLEEQDKKIKISISEFDDLRLKDVLDSARQKSDDADIVAMQLEVLEIVKMDEILARRNIHYRRELEVLSRGLSDAETDNKLSGIRKDERRDIVRVRAKYGRIIREKRRELNALLEKKKEAKEKIEDKRVLTNEDKLYAMRTKKLKKEQKKGTNLLKGYLRRYSLFVKRKYDPVFISREVNGIIKSDYYRKQREDKSFYEKYEGLLGSKRPLNQKAFEKLQKRVLSHDLIMRRLKRIPYDNSVSPALSQVDYLTKSIIYDYEKQIRKRDQELNNFRYAFNYILNLKPENGYIIDARNPDIIKFHMYRALRVSSGETAMVFRDEDEYIGKIQFVMKPYGMRAKMIETEKGKQIRPFDKILLELKELKKEKP